MPEFFVVDIVGRIKCPAYIGCGDTPTRNTNLVNLTTELENVNLFFCCCCFVCFFVVCVYRHFSIIKRVFQTLNYFSFECFKNTLLFCVCVLVVLQEGLITAYIGKWFPLKNARVHSL